MMGVQSSVSAIPEELRALDQWLLWRWETRDGKPTKPPYQPNGQYAKSTDPGTWVSFEKAWAAYERGGFDGVGLALTETDPFAAVDLDHCIADDGRLTPEAAHIVERLNSYTEVTPSGKGLRVIVKAKLPPGGRKRGNIEIYDSARYVTVTGSQYPGTPATIEERSGALAEIHGEIFGSEASTPMPAGQSAPVGDDQELLTRARAARSGPAFSALWRGDTTGYPSPSEADLALCAHLAFWTGGDADRVDTLFRQSGLYRPKWDERHFQDRATYGQATIAKALRGMAASQSGGGGGQPGQAHGESVDLAALLYNLLAFVTRYVVLSPHQPDAIALWVAHTHAVDAAESTPYLAISSPEKRSGKTRLLEALELLVARPWLTGRTTPAALARKVDKNCPTLLLDESDAAFKGDKEYAETLRSVLNTGHRRGGKVTVCVGQGANLDFRDFSTFCPKAIAGIGKLPDTVSDRSIGIVLKRRAPNEPVERFRYRDAALEGAPLRESLALWASQVVPTLRNARPAIPDVLDDRASEGWELLLAIADMAGRDWPQRARDAARVLSAGASHEDESIGVRLLTDIRTAFKEAGTDKLFTADLLKRLNGMEESPWGGWQDGAFTGRALARILKPYGIGPKQVRIDEKSLKGYEEASFADAWERYTPIYAKQGNTKDGEDASSFEPSETNPKMFPQDVIAAKAKARYDVSHVSDKHALQGGNTTANGLEV